MNLILKIYLNETSADSIVSICSVEIIDFSLKGGAFLDQFFINLIPNEYYDYEENEALPVHELILRPLLLCAKECYVYGLKKDTELFQQCTDILSFTRNKYKLDLKKEVIKGYEQL